MSHSFFHKLFLGERWTWENWRRQWWWQWEGWGSTKKEEVRQTWFRWQWWRRRWRKSKIL